MRSLSSGESSSVLSCFVLVVGSVASNFMVFIFLLCVLLWVLGVFLFLGGVVVL